MAKQKKNVSTDELLGQLKTYMDDTLSEEERIERADSYTGTAPASVEELMARLREKGYIETVGTENAPEKSVYASDEEGEFSESEFTSDESDNASDVEDGDISTDDSEEVSDDNSSPVKKEESSSDAQPSRIEVEEVADEASETASSVVQTEEKKKKPRVKGKRYRFIESFFEGEVGSSDEPIEIDVNTDGTGDSDTVVDEGFTALTI